VQHPWQNSVMRVFLFWLFYLGPTLTLPFLILLLGLHYGANVSEFSPPLRFLLLTAGISFAGMLLPVIFLQHYAAPLTAVVYAFVLSTMRYIRPLFFGAKPVGLGVTRAIVLCSVLLVFVRILAPICGIPLTRPKLTTWASENYNFSERPAAAFPLNRLHGLQLVFVKNRTDQSEFDWVYNAADIDASKIVWARDLGATKNQELIDYYSNRKVWIIDPKDTPPKLMPYPFSRAAQTH
jgi:hypothetical protein